MLKISKLKFKKKEVLNSEGQNSSTYKILDPQLDAELVLKEIKKESLNKLGEEDYFKESKILYMCEHPNICKIRWSTYDEENIYISMPFYKNGSLNKYINENILTVREIIKYSLDILTGLHYIHSKRLVHFDIKPTNILIDNSGKAIITDFGLSKFLNENDFAENKIFYRMHMPYEAIIDDKAKLTNQSDIYQFGLTLYRMLVSKEDWELLFNDISWDDFKKLIEEKKFPNMDFIRPHIIKSIKDILKKCIEIDLEKRYNSVIEIINDFSKIDYALDWKLSYSNNGFILERDEDTSIRIIEARYLNNNKITVIQKTKNKENGKERKVKKDEEIFKNLNKFLTYLKKL